MTARGDRPIVVVDFDGTLTRVDVGDAVCNRFAPPEWREIDERWLRGEIMLPEAQRGMWALVRATEEAVAAYAAEVGALRPGAEELLQAGIDGRLDLVLASGGFEVYIDRILGAWSAAFRARYANRLSWRGDRCEVVFPWPDLACATCAICKGEIVRRHRGEGRPVVFVGDGSSDACAAPDARQVFAVQGGLFEKSCRERGIPHTSFLDLCDVLDRLGLR